MADMDHARKMRIMWSQNEEELPEDQSSGLSCMGYSLPSPGRELTGPTNFNFWKFRIKSILEPQGLMALLSLEIPRPRPICYDNDYDDEAEYNADVWKSTSKLVARWLVDSISVEIFNKFEEGKSFVYADEAWALIEQTIEGQGPPALNSHIMNADNSYQTEMRSASNTPTPDSAVGELQPVGDVESSRPPYTKVTVTNSHENIEDFFSYVVQDVKMQDVMFQVMLTIDFWGLKVGSIVADEHSIQVRLAHHFKDREVWLLSCSDMVTMHGFRDMDED